MKRPTLLTLGLALLALWSMAAPLILAIHSLIPMCEDYYVEHWGSVPNDYLAVAGTVTARRFIAFCLVVSGAMIVLEFVLRSERLRFISQITCLAFWLLTTALCFHLVSHPYFMDIGIPVRERKAAALGTPMQSAAEDISTPAASEK